MSNKSGKQTARKKTATTSNTGSDDRQQASTESALPPVCLECNKLCGVYREWHCCVCQQPIDPDGCPCGVDGGTYYHEVPGCFYFPDGLPDGPPDEQDVDTEEWRAVLN